MGIGAAQRAPVEHARQDQICYKFGLAHRLLQAIDLGIGFADNV